MKVPDKVYWPTKGGGELHTILLVDADFPSNCDNRESCWQHWLVGNIPGSNLCYGQTLSEYIGPVAGKGTDIHRYVFVVYKQNGRLCFREPGLKSSSTCGRNKFNVKSFQLRYTFEDIIAVNFFVACNNSCVDQLRAQLGMGC